MDVREFIIHVPKVSRSPLDLHLRGERTWTRLSISVTCMGKKGRLSPLAIGALSAEMATNFFVNQSGQLPTDRWTPGNFDPDKLYGQEPDLGQNRPRHILKCLLGCVLRVGDILANPYIAGNVPGSASKSESQVLRDAGYYHSTP